MKTQRSNGRSNSQGRSVPENSTHDGDHREAHKLARTLGWFSLGLGVAQLSAPREVSRLCGVDDSAVAPAVTRAVGVRELGHAAGLLGGWIPASALWSRVAGDVVDLTVLSRALRRRGGARRRRATTATAAVAGITAIDLFAAARASRARAGTQRPGALRVRAASTVKQPRDEVYRYWHDFENLPTFMYHLESVRMTGEPLSRWRAKAPAGMRVEWDAEMIEDRTNELIAWRSLPGADVPNTGAVRFTDAPGGLGTEVRVEIEYNPPGGALGEVVAKMFGEAPEQQIRDDLRRFKQVMETGEVVRSEGSPQGTSARQQRRQRPAQPVQPAGATR